MTSPIRYAAFTTCTFKHQVYPEIIGDHETVHEAMNDARIDYKNDRREILCVAEINLATGEIKSIHNRKQLETLFDAEEEAEREADHEDEVYGSYVEQHTRAMRGSFI